MRIKRAYSILVVVTVLLISGIYLYFGFSIKNVHEQTLNDQEDRLPEEFNFFNAAFDNEYEGNDGTYQTDNYVVYQEETAIVVEGKKETDNFYWKEHISYFNIGSAIDAYLCDKNGEKTESEKDIFLYVDFGNLGEWWCDPFGNLNSDLQVDAEFISDELVEKMQKKILESWYDADIREMEQNTGIVQLTMQELEERIPESTMNEIFAEYGEWQNYYEVDFDNDGKKDIVVNNGVGMGSAGYIYYFENGHPIELVSLTFDPQVVNSISCEEMNQEELEVGVTVKKKFVNDFINMSYGPW